MSTQFKETWALEKIPQGGAACHVGAVHELLERDTCVLAEELEQGGRG